MTGAIASISRGSGDRKKVPITPPPTKVLFHPRRALILASLGEGPATPAQLSQRLGQGAGPLAYHLRVLAAAGCIRPVGTRGEGAERAYETVAPATRARARP